MTTTRPLSDLLSLMRPASALAPTEFVFSVPTWQVPAGAALLLEGVCSTHVYVIRSGTFKCVKTTVDGCEQVLSFAGQGDVLAVEAMSSAPQPVGAVALHAASVYGLPVSQIEDWRRLSPSFDHWLQDALSGQRSRAGEMAEMMSANASDVRLARFIVWWSKRSAERGQSPHRLLLRMSRREIASLLGLAHETVSRCFSSLVDHGLLRVNRRQIEILDPVGLKARAGTTAGPGDEMPRDNRLDDSKGAFRPRSRQAVAAAARPTN